MSIATRLADAVERLDSEVAAQLRRERARRPRRVARRRSVSIAVRLEPAVAELWRLAAAAEGITLTEWMERAARARLQSTTLELVESGRRSTPQSEEQMVRALSASLLAVQSR